ncbi:Gelation factor [Geodia barretti]|uniref:Gelation factor n=1 Tax=Geodia barretti TaxID=519541 RepID=A0AA35QTH6_GEOBA|nr:Gelation factor [Geodia barretti]
MGVSASLSLPFLHLFSVLLQKFKKFAGMADASPNEILDLEQEPQRPITAGSYSEKRAEFRQHRGVFSLLAAHPETRPTPKKTTGKEDAEWVKVQMNTFMKWANSILQKGGHPPMTNLIEDMKDGVVLISLLEILTGKEIGMKYHKQPKTRVQMVDNLQVAFKFMEAEKLEHTSMNPNDIVDGNLKLLLGILWRFIFKYQISGNLHKPRLSRPNSDWSDGVKLSALVNYCKPGLIPNWDQKDPQNAFENIHNAISLAHEHFTIPEVLHAEDLAVEKPDRQAAMTYLSYFCCPGSPGEKVLMEWIELVIPEVKITNFTSDWKDGESLCALVSAFAPSAISREALEGKSNVEITRAAMEAAKEQFNISCLSSPEEFTSPTCDQLSVMVYLSHFRFIKEERRKLPYLSALGSGITGTEIGTEAQLQIEGEMLDGSIVEVRVQSPDLGEVEVHEIPVRSGTPGFQYRPTVPGTYTVEVKYSGEHVKGSPYKVRHLPPLDSVTGGRGLHRACVGRQAEFTVDVSNLGEGVLNFRILDPDDMPLDNVHMTEATAEYTVTYTPWRSGDHKIQLEWDCTPVTDEIDVDESFNTLECTYTVSVFDISKCVVRGSWALGGNYWGARLV